MPPRVSKTGKSSARARSGLSTNSRASTPAILQDGSNVSGGSQVDDGYIPMIWTDEAGIKKTWDLLWYIKENQYLRRSLYPRPGKDSTPLTHTHVHQKLADYLLKDDATFGDIYSKLKGKYVRAIKARLHKLYETYTQKRMLLANSGAALSDADRYRYPDVQNLPELVRKQVPWYDLMDEFLHERATLGVNSLVNSDDQAGLTVVGWGRTGGLSAARGSDPGSAVVHPAPKITADEDNGDDKGGDEESPAGSPSDGVEPDGSKDNPVPTRNPCMAPVDMSPIESAIRHGDVLREKSKKERLEMLTLVREAETSKKLESKERRAAAEREYKLKREEMRLRFATEKLSLQIQQSDSERKLIEARIHEAEVLMKTQCIGSTGITGVSDGGSDDGAGPSQNSSVTRNPKRIWEDN